MDNTNRILINLNPAQREAVTAPISNLLILAGAGSGKTRVLVHRIAWLIEQYNVDPWSILAVTFTNKAARELKERLDNLIRIPINNMWVGTFHGLAHKLLRIHYKDAGLPASFQILDAEDQLRLIKRTQQSLDLNEDNWPLRKCQWFINSQKDEGIRPDHIDDKGQSFLGTLIEVYRTYQKFCTRLGQVDFAELLLRAHELLRDNSELLQHYQTRFSHILVDEFQDTNTIQYAWLKLLTGEQKKLFAVGDDDQAIYAWRGARVENIQMLQQDIPNTQLLRLEQNYRSTRAILDAANRLIAQNQSRLGKELWTQGQEGSPIVIHRAFNEVDEARFVVERIRRFIIEGRHHAEIAILYRTTAQSRLFEETLSRFAIPYRVYGGVRFFERAEIKDAIAYLRLIANSDDDASLERAVGIPPRGIGERTLEVLRDRAQNFGISLWQAAKTVPKNVVASRSINAVGAFIRLIENAYEEMQGLELSLAVRRVIEISGLLEYYKNIKDNLGPDRLENLLELINVSQRFNEEYAAQKTINLTDFLAYIALESGEIDNGNTNSAVQLMTLHAAKGLEFPCVFITGMEEGLFPHQMSKGETPRLEEERRLCYVGMTRAMQHLYLTHAESRRLYNSSNMAIPSRFIEEIQGSKQSNTQRLSQQQKVTTSTGLRLGIGSRIWHPIFGEGIILDLGGQGNDAKAQICFNTAGTKWLLLSYANLQSPK